MAGEYEMGGAGFSYPVCVGVMALVEGAYPGGYDCAGGVCDGKAGAAP